MRQRGETVKRIEQLMWMLVIGRLGKLPLHSIFFTDQIRSVCFLNVMLSFVIKLNCFFGKKVFLNISDKTYTTKNSYLERMF